MSTPVTEIEPSAPPRVEPEPARPWISEWVVTIIVLLYFTTIAAQPFVIPSGSMEDTLLIGDHVVVDKLAYAPAGPISKYFLPYSDIKRGDIIVFRYPPNIAETYVKRVIGVPGDRIRIFNKQLYVNGVAVQEPYKVHKTHYSDPYRDYFPSEPNAPLPDSALRMLERQVVNGELVVPPKMYFAMGDNRDNSLDSRYWGFVPQDNIVGKPVVIWWSFDADGRELANRNVVSLRYLGYLVTHFFSKTRWNRTFRLVHGATIP